MTEDTKQDEKDGGTAEATATEDVEDEAGADPDGEKAFVFVEDPVYDVDHQGDCAYEVKVSIPDANAKKKAEELFDELKAETELPGFRRGRAPRKLIERKFAKAIKGEVDASLVSAAYEKFLKDQELTALGMPDVDGLEDAKDREESASLEFTLKFEVLPRVELGKYRGIEATRPVVSIDDKDIEDSVAQIQARQALFENLEGGVAADGDQVTIDFNGTVDGEAFSGGTAENYPYIIGSTRFLPEFEAALLGVSPGDELTCDVSFPEDYFSEDLRGKVGSFEIKVNEVKRKTVPELNDEFAKQANFDDMEDMRTKIRERLEESSNRTSKMLAEQKVLEAVIEASTFEIPKSLIESTNEECYQGEVQRLLQARTPMSEIEENEEKIRAEAADEALRRIKSTVVLNEIGEAEGIEVTDEDLEKEAGTMASSMGVEFDRVAEFMSSDEHRGSYMGRILRAKAIAVITDNAEFTDEELSRDDQLDEEQPEEGD